MSTTTTVLSLIKHADGDNARTALSTDQPATMDIIDALFHATTGHTHTGAGTNGTKIPYGSIAADGWTGFTPTLTQSAGITITVTSARYCVVGKIAHVQVALACTSAGTGSNSIVLASIPAAIQPKVTASYMPLGTATFDDTGTKLYCLFPYRTGATTIGFLDTADGAVLGVAAPTIANGDSLMVNMVYEIA